MCDQVAFRHVGENERGLSKVRGGEERFEGRLRDV
jgi:hypothetical protein